MRLTILLIVLALSLYLDPIFNRTAYSVITDNHLTRTRPQHSQTAKWSLSQHAITLENKRLRYSIAGMYPYLKGNSDKARQFNNAVTQTILRQYREILHPNLGKLRERIASMPDHQFIDEAQFEYEVLSENESLISIRFRGTVYSHPAVHDIAQYFTLTYDKIRSRPLFLKALFVPKRNFYRRLVVLSAREFSKQGMNPYDYDGRLGSIVYRFLIDYLRRYEQWNISPEGIVLSFDQCTFPDCAHGAVSVTISLRDLQNILRAGVVRKFRNIS